MKATSITILLILVFASPAFPVVLTDDLQVVVPTGQPTLEELQPCYMYSESQSHDIIFHWEHGNSSIVFINDQLMSEKFYDQQLLNELNSLDELLNQHFQTLFDRKGKTISINVILE